MFLHYIWYTARKGHAQGEAVCGCIWRSWLVVLVPTVASPCSPLHHRPCIAGRAGPAKPPSLTIETRAGNGVDQWPPQTTALLLSAAFSTWSAVCLPTEEEQYRSKLVEGVSAKKCVSDNLVWGRQLQLQPTRRLNKVQNTRMFLTPQRNERI